MLVWTIIILSSSWVYFDAKKIGAQRGLISGFFNLGPFAWALCCLLLWIIGFPAYLIMRPKIKAAAGSDTDLKSGGYVEQSWMNSAAKFIAIGWTLLLGIIFITGMTELGKTVPTSGNDFETAGFAIGATLGVGMYFIIWVVVAVPATIIFLVTRRSGEPVVIVDERPRQNSHELTKKCPFCAEKIKAEAVLCRFCNKELSQSPPPQPPSSQAPVVEEKAQPPTIDWAALAKARLKMENFSEAVLMCTKAIENNGSGEEYYLRAVAYSKMKDHKKMRADLEAAAALGHSRAKEALGKMTAACG